VEHIVTVAGARRLLEPGADPLDEPLICVDLDASGSDLKLPYDAIRPAVVIGVSTRARQPIPDGVDVALSGVESEGPWVTISGTQSDLSELCSAIRAHPAASLVACQVMRLNQGLRPSEALLAESLAYGMLQSGPEHRAWLSANPRRHRADGQDDRPDVRLDREGDALTLTLQRPEVRNAIRARTRDDMASGLDLALLDASITSVRLRGEGSCFSSGGDLGEFGTLSDTASGHLIRSMRSPAAKLASLSDRSVAYMNGPCRGGGVELAAACGIVRAAPGTTAALPEVKMGLIPGAGGTWSIPMRIGRQRATWLAITGHVLSVERLLSWGLVDAISEDADPSD
jgi:enoyl-CoA hydratase/carnithine racemase